MILSDLLPNKDHRISSSDFCLKPSNLWFKQSISTRLLSSFDARMLNEALTTSHAVKTWLFYRLSASLHHCITCHSLPKDMKIFICFAHSIKTLKQSERGKMEILKHKTSGKDTPAEG